MFLLLICTGQPPACPTQNVPSLGTIISFMIFPYLSSTPPEIGKSFRRPAAYRFHRPFYPSVVLTEPSFRRKSHYAVMDLRRNPGAVRLLQASCRSGLPTVFALAADVAPHHRFVPDECLFSCQGAWFAFSCNNLVVTSHILEEKTTFAVGPVGLFSRPRGPTFTDFGQVLSAER